MFRRPLVARFRTRLGGTGASMTVVKNTFLRRSIKDAGLPELDAHLKGQTAFVTGEKDICAAAKILKTFAAEFEKPKIRAGILDNSLLETAQVIALADLPSKEVLQAQLLGLLLMPATKLVRTLNEPAASLARVLAAIAEKAPAAPSVPTAPAEVAAEAAPATEAPAVPDASAPVAEVPAAE
jgi:large subunit ribosomal protein L10